MNKQDAIEFTQCLGLFTGATWRLIAHAKKQGVPKSMGLSTEQWVNEHLGGYIRMAVEDRREIAVELASGGASTREIAEVLGVSPATAARDIREANAPATEPEPAITMDAMAAITLGGKTAADIAAIGSAKDAWIAAARRAFNPGARAPCAVCRKYQWITHAHHIVPLAVQYDNGAREPNHERAWLCPNHHSIVHIFISSASKGEDIQSTIRSMMEEIDEDEIKLILKFVHTFDAANTTHA